MVRRTVEAGSTTIITVTDTLATEEDATVSSAVVTGASVDVTFTFAVTVNVTFVTIVTVVTVVIDVTVTAIVVVVTVIVAAVVKPLLLGSIPLLHLTYCWTSLKHSTEGCHQ